MMNIIGIDLATKSGTTCLCHYDEEPVVYLIKEDKEIFDIIRSAKPQVITIDAPLSYPQSTQRKEEEELNKLGLPALPPNMPGMKELTHRAVNLKEQMKEFTVFEVYPFATKKILGLNIEKNDINDAYICAITGILYLKNKTELFGEGLLVPCPDIFDHNI